MYLIKTVSCDIFYIVTVSFPNVLMNLFCMQLYPEMKVRDIVDSGSLCQCHHGNFLVYAITHKPITIFLNLVCRLRLTKGRSLF